MEEHEKIELRSDDVQEIIGTPPRWIVRWGTLIVSFAVISLVSMSFFVKYPDKVGGAVKVTSKTAAVRVNAQQSGRIEKIYVEDGDTISRGDLLVLMQDAANYEDMEELEELIKEMQGYSKEELLDFDTYQFQKWEIGSLQPLYSQLQTDFKNFQFTEVNQAAAKEIRDIRNQMAQIRAGIKILERTKKAAEEQTKITYNQWQRARTAYQQGVEPLVYLEEKKRAHFQAKENVESFKRQINDKYLNISQLNGTITNRQITSSETNNVNSVQLERSINNLLGEIKNWNEKNLVIAAMDGKISMPDNWSKNQNFQQGAEIMAILPKDIQENLFIQMFIPIQGSGKVKVGQRVLLKFDNYPYREYGQVDGEVLELPGLPRDNAMPVRIKLTNGLVTRSKKELKFEQEMRGRGEIITEDRTVFVRIFENIIQPFKET